MVSVRQEFTRVLENAVLGMGFPPEIGMVVFPMALFLEESDLSPIKDNIDKYVDALTRWEPKTKGKTAITPSKVTVKGRSYEDAVVNMNHLFLRNQWGDGLPLLTPTEERLQWIMQGTDLSPDTEMGKILPKGGLATVKTLAIALAMAGGRPEYLPVLIAAVEVILDPDEPGIAHQRWQATSCSSYPVVIVNGPIAEQIRLNSGFGLLGPDSLHPGGGSIGRAIRLLLQNAGGAIPGTGTMAMFGLMRFTNAVFAEDEEQYPPGWEPLNVEYFGYPRGTNTVSMYVASSATNIFRIGGGTVEEVALTGLYRIASYMRTPNMNSFHYGYKEGTPGILMLSSVVANQMAEVGWTKEKIKEFLWENTKAPLSVLEREGMVYEIKRCELEDTLQDPWPLTGKPENLMLLVAGGRHPTHALWMQGAQCSKAKSAEIKLPVKSKWEELLKKAEEDLGPLP